jgi:predicted DCC family thiol-disulfide oxidoreductase YuxK
MTPALSEACVDAVHVIRADGTILRAGRASLFIASELGWRRSSWILGLPPFIWFVELAYAFVARNRAFVSRYAFRKPQ